MLPVYVKVSCAVLSFAESYDYELVTTVPYR